VTTTVRCNIMCMIATFLQLFYQYYYIKYYLLLLPQFVVYNDTAFERNDDRQNYGKIFRMNYTDGEFLLP
jgi:hypothetical protein